MMVDMDTNILNKISVIMIGIEAGLKKTVAYKKNRVI